MKIGLIDCDRKNNKNVFPNVPLMKLAACETFEDYKTEK